MIYTTKISRYDIEILTKRNMKSSLPKVEDLDENNFNNFNIFRFRNSKRYDISVIKVSVKRATGLSTENSLLSRKDC